MAAQIYNFVCLVFILGQKCHFVHARVANVACQEVKYKYSAKVDGYDNPVSYTHLTLPTNREV